MFRASHSHNPPRYSQSCVALPHFLLISGHATNPYSHDCASASGKWIVALVSLYGDPCDKVDQKEMQRIEQIKRVFVTGTLIGVVKIQKNK